MLEIFTADTNVVIGKCARRLVHLPPTLYIYIYKWCIILYPLFWQVTKQHLTLAIHIAYIHEYMLIFSISQGVFFKEISGIRISAAQVIGLGFVCFLLFYALATVFQLYHPRFLRQSLTNFSETLNSLAALLLFLCSCAQQHI